MKVGIYIGSTDPKRGGEGTLTRKIIREIISDTDQTFEYVFLYTYEKKTAYKRHIHGYEFINISNCCGQLALLESGIVESIGRGSNRFFKLDKVAENEKIDMFYFAAPIFAQTSLPYIFTVWDLGHRTTPYFPEVSGEEWGIREKMYQHMLPRATYIVTGNEHGKKELLQYYMLDPERIRIIQFPISDFCYGPECKPAFDVEEDFFFYPAQFWAHKNHICILDALVSLKSKHGHEPKMFFTGTDKGNLHYIEKKIKELHLEHQVIITGFLKNSELKYLYTHATAMVFASLLGPNNLPPIEAAYLGCPVIISNLPGHIEQMGEKALYFDGYNPDELSDAMNRVIGDMELRNKLTGKEFHFPQESYFGSIKHLIKEFEGIRKRWS